MLKNLYICFVALFFFSGCVTAKTYVVNKPRVDQEIPGMPVQAPVKTRKVMVVEMIEKDKVQAPSLIQSKQAPVVDMKQVDAVVTDHDKEEVLDVPKESKVSDEEKDFSLPTSTLPLVKVEETLITPQEYVVVKDDTLQKISKKVYGSYGKWTKIYDANRDQLKDPNFLKSGMKLKIPALGIE